MSDDPLLAAAFPPAEREAWLKLVQATLKDRPYEKLIAKTYDGIPIEPLYGRATGATPIAMRRGPWQILSRIDHPDAAASNDEALHELENGAGGLTLVFNGAFRDSGFGISASEAAIRQALDGIHLDARVGIELEAGPQAETVAHSVAALVEARGVAPVMTDIRFGFDPIGTMATAGGVTQPWDKAAAGFGAAITALVAKGFRGPFAVADGRIVHAAGGSEAQELGFVLAVAVAYLRALEAGGVPLDAARKMIFFRLAADADEFLTISKFRALRKLWARVEESCGFSAHPTFITAETAWRMMTQRDPWVNMLRTSIAAFAAGLGGADAITVLPFTAALGLPDRFARRIARNTQLLLLEESNLAKVSDPAAGAGGIENLTDQLCRAAWVLFQEIEKAGGAAVALEQQIIQRNIAATRAAHMAAVAQRKDVLTGTSDFPNLKERPVEVLDIRPTARPDAPAPNTPFTALPCIRLAEPFERLRDQSDRILAASGSRPKVFLANLGTIAQFAARAGFAKTFFETGGIEAVSTDGFATSGDMIAAFKASGATIVCLCGNDETYASEAAAAATALAAAGARHVYLAGRPRDLKPFEAAGIGTFIFMGCDAIAVLVAAYERIAPAP